MSKFSEAIENMKERANRAGNAARDLFIRKKNAETAENTEETEHTEHDDREYGMSMNPADEGAETRANIGNRTEDGAASIQPAIPPANQGAKSKSRTSSNFIHQIPTKNSAAKAAKQAKPTRHADDEQDFFSAVEPLASIPNSAHPTNQQSQNHYQNLGQNPGQNQNRIYLDHASLTPMDPRVKKVMMEAIDEYPANPSSLYKEGVKAKKALYDARVSIGQFFSVQPDEVVFTSGGTESNHLAFHGVLDECLAASDSAKPHFVISTIEHPSIVEIALDLTSRGYDVSFVPVNKDGIVDPKDVKKALRPETVLVSIMYANNEIGTLQPIKDIAREIRHYKKGLDRGAAEYPYFHTDACQAVLFEDMRISTLGVDLVSVDGGKIYGPRGIGALIRRRHVALAPVMVGGSQENGLRAGTENLPAIIGLKHALDIAHSERDEMTTKMGRFRESMHDLLFARLGTFIPNMSLNGHPSDRLPNNLNICFPNMDAEFLVLRLDALGIALSSVTSCRANDEDSSSYVIEALGKNDPCAGSSLRITFGRFTTTEDVATAIEGIVQAVKEQMEA
jgi:cysteine desulfurase